MSASVGLLLGLGLFPVRRSCWIVPAPSVRPHRSSRLEDELLEAGIQRVTPRAAVASSVVSGLFVALLVLAGTGGTRTVNGELAG